MRGCGKVTHVGDVAGSHMWGAWQDHIGEGVWQGHTCGGRGRITQVRGCGGVAQMRGSHR